MANDVIYLLDNASATGSWVRWPGGAGVFKAIGSFDGATLSLEYKAPDRSTARAVSPYTTLTAAGEIGFILDACDIRVSVTGGTSPAGLYATAGIVPSGGL